MAKESCHCGSVVLDIHFSPELELFAIRGCDNPFLTIGDTPLLAIQNKSVLISIEGVSIVGTMDGYAPDGTFSAWVLLASDLSFFSNSFSLDILGPFKQCKNKKVRCFK